MSYPDWLGPLGKKDEALRAAHGLYPARDGWYKTIQGKKRYIASRKKSLREVVDILDARKQEIEEAVEIKKSVPLSRVNTTISELIDTFLEHLWQRHLTGNPRKLARRTYDDYMEVLSRFAEIVGPSRMAANANPSWFSMYARTFAGKAVTTRRREIIYITAFFNWAGPGRHSLNFYKEAVKFGPDFQKPDELTLQTALDANSKLYTPEEFKAAMNKVRSIPVLWATGLLALNAAYLGSDITTLPETMVDLLTGVIEDFPRGKTGLPRKAALMPETVTAICWYLKHRNKREDAGDFLFTSDEGFRYNRRQTSAPDERVNHTDTIGFYWRTITGMPISGLRTTFATAADGWHDDKAIDVVMGHGKKTTRDKNYIKHFDVGRVRAVTERVWQRYVSELGLPNARVVAPASLLRKAARPRKKASRPL